MDRNGALIKELKYWAHNFSWSPEGNILASCFVNENTIRLWNREGVLINTLIGHKYGVDALSWSLDGKILASGSQGDNDIFLWNREGVLIKKINRFTHGIESQIGNLAWSPDGKILAGGSRDGTVFICSRNEMTIKELKPHPCEYVSTYVAWSADGSILISCSPQDNLVRVWDPKGELIKEYINYLSYCWNKDGTLFAFGSSDGKIEIWNRKGKLINSFSGSTTRINCLRFSPDGKLILSIDDEDRRIRVWRRNGDLIKVIIIYGVQISNQWGKNRISLDWSPDGNRLIISSLNSATYFWNIKTGTWTAHLASRSGGYIVYTFDHYYYSSGDAINALAFVKGSSIYSLNQFALKYHRPDKVLEGMYPDADNRPAAIARAIVRHRKQWRRLIRNNGFTEYHIDAKPVIHAPVISNIQLNGVDISKANRQIKNRTATISFTVKDEEGSHFNVIGYKICINGVPVHGSYIKRFDKPVLTGTVTETITLPKGQGSTDKSEIVKIELSGFTEDGVESRRKIVRLKNFGN